MVRRTFSNPYRDRSLELRFIPVFRRFDVTTSLVRGEPGVLLRPGLIDFAAPAARAKIGAFVKTRALDPAIAQAGDVDPGQEEELPAARRAAAVTEHLSSNAAMYTRGFLEHTNAIGDRDVLLSPFATMLGGQPARSTRAAGSAAVSGSIGLADGLSWSQAKVRNGEIHVPLGESANWPRTWKGPAASGLSKAIGQTIADSAWLGQWTRTRSVHLFMGTHVEAVAGTCVLADLPEVSGDA